MQRLDAEVIAREKEAPVLCIPDRKPEHAAQPPEQLRPPLLEAVDQNLGVRLRREDVALFKQLLPQALIIIDLAVEGEHERFVLVVDRLVAALAHINDAQTAEAHGDPLAEVKAAAVRPRCVMTSVMPRSAVSRSTISPVKPQIPHIGSYSPISVFGASCALAAASSRFSSACSACGSGEGSPPDSSVPSASGAAEGSFSASCACAPVCGAVSAGSAGFPLACAVSSFVSGVFPEGSAAAAAGSAVFRPYPAAPSAAARRRGGSGTGDRAHIFRSRREIPLRPGEEGSARWTAPAGKRQRTSCGAQAPPRPRQRRKIRCGRRPRRSNSRSPARRAFLFRAQHHREQELDQLRRPVVQTVLKEQDFSLRVASEPVTRLRTPRSCGNCAPIPAAFAGSGFPGRI